MSRKKSNAPDPTAASRLKSFIERIEKLEEERKAIAGDIRDVYGEAKGHGFDTKTIRKIVALRKQSEAQREEEEALLDIYKAALGMLGDTPLGEAAIRRMQGKKPGDPKPPPPQPPGEAGGEPQEPALEPPPAAEQGPAAPEWAADDTAMARERGAAAANAGKPIITNPDPPHDPRRAAWDEAWCQATGSDGMDIPAAFRRTPKPKKGEGKPDDGNEGGEAPPPPAGGEGPEARP